MIAVGITVPASEAQPVPIAPHPRERQVLVNIGNRYVVFGSQAQMHGRRRLGPEDVRTRFAERVGDEMDFPSERLITSIQVDDAEVDCSPSDDTSAPDLRITYANGAVITADVSVWTRDFKSTELERHWARIREPARGPGLQYEVWNFNIDRLKLTILFYQDGFPQFADLEPLYIWEFGKDGSIFDRTILDERLEDWQQRIAAIYAKAEEWGTREGLTADRSRTVLMSEELMQRFGVPDRELAILDLSRGETPAVSIVPAGLWVIGSRGAIDVITQDQSVILLDASREVGTSNWVYIIRGAQRDARPWDEAAFRSLIGADVHA